jgi:hypothetical protein
MAIAWQSTRRQILFFREEEDWYYCSTVHDWVDDSPAGSAHASNFGAMCLASPSCSGCSLVASRAGLWVSSIGVQTSCYFCFRRRKGGSGRSRDPRLLCLGRGFRSRPSFRGRWRWSKRNTVPSCFCFLNEWGLVFLLLPLYKKSNFLFWI